MALINDLKCSGEWWHPPIEEEPEKKNKVVKSRKPPGSKEQKTSKSGISKKDAKKKSQDSKESKNPTESKNGEDAKADSADAGAKDKKKNLKKKGVADESMVAVPENFRKTAAGKELIKQTLRRIRAADQKGFPTQPLFDSEENVCSSLRSATKFHGPMFWRDLLSSSVWSVLVNVYVESYEGFCFCDFLPLGDCGSHHGMMRSAVLMC